MPPHPIPVFNTCLTYETPRLLSLCIHFEPGLMTTNLVQTWFPKHEGITNAQLRKNQTKCNYHLKEPAIFINLLFFQIFCDQTHCMLKRLGGPETRLHFTQKRE